MVLNIDRALAEEIPRRSKRTIRKFSCYPEVKLETRKNIKIYNSSNPRRSKRTINKYSSHPLNLERPEIQLESHGSSDKDNMSRLVLKTRRTLPEIRQEMLEKGALLLKFRRPDCGPISKEHFKRFQRIQQGGILVTTTGCMFPHDTYLKYKSRERPFAYKTAAFFFLGLVPDFGKHKKGWSTRAEVSHRCHRKDCINPCHILYEPHWKNVKRNYCGDNEAGTCDCGVEPKCVAEFQTSNWVFNDKYITYDTKNHEKALQTILGGYKFEVLDLDTFHSKDTEALVKTAQRRANRLAMLSHPQKLQLHRQCKKTNKYY